jgi:hypothetical protein
MTDRTSAPPRTRRARPCCLPHRARATLSGDRPGRVRRGTGGHDPDQATELLEDLADGAAAREALEEPGEDIPAEQVWAELGLT